MRVFNLQNVFCWDQSWNHREKVPILSAQKSTSLKRDSLKANCFIVRIEDQYRKHSLGCLSPVAVSLRREAWRLPEVLGSLAKGGVLTGSKGYFKEELTPNTNTSASSEFQVRAMTLELSNYYETLPFNFQKMISKSCPALSECISIIQQEESRVSFGRKSKEF